MTGKVYNVYGAVRPSKSKKTTLLKICVVCGNTFAPKCATKKCCCDACTSEYYKKRDGRVSLYENLPPSTVGTISEHLVCLDLLKAGYYVFKSITPNSPYDIVATKENKSYKIEVRTGYYGEAGRLIYSTKTKHTENPYDILACVVLSNGSVTYIPPLPGGDQ